MTVKKPKCVRKAKSCEVVTTEKQVFRYVVTLECGHTVKKPFYENVQTMRRAPEPKSATCKECTKALMDRQMTLFGEAS